MMRFFVPGKGPIVITIIGGLVAMLGGLMALLIGVDSGEMVSMAGMGVGMFAIFPFILALGLAGAVEDKAGAKAALFGVGAAAALPLMIAVSFGMTGQDNGVGSAIGGGVCCSAPMFLGMLIPAILYGFQAPAAMKEAARQQRADAMAALLDEEGEVNLDHFASQHGADPRAIRDAAEALRDRSDGAVMLDPAGKLLFKRSAFNERKARLASLIKLRGRLRITDAASELRVSEEKVRELVHALVQEDAFDGYADWEAGVLSSRDARNLGAAARCESCGGRMGLAGKGLLKCDRCGAEIYL